MRLVSGIVAICLVAGAGLLTLAVANTSTPRPLVNADLSTAISPVVYQLDESSSDRGYHYIFYGNAFFVDRDGYLITAAHVLSDFHDGGQPYLLLRLPEAPPRLVKAEVVSMDMLHDVAVLRAEPNPFEASIRFPILCSMRINLRSARRCLPQHSGPRTSRIHTRLTRPGKSIRPRK